MRSFVLLFCTLSMAINSNNLSSQNAKITIDENKAITVDEVFKLIIDQTDYVFLYHEDMFKGYPKVDVKKGTIRANKLIEKSLSYGDFRVSLSNKNTIIISNKFRNILPQQTITGTVTDIEGVPMAGVTVVIKGSTTGVATNFDGEYSIKATKGEVLAFTYLGYTSQEIIVQDQQVINVTLKEGSAQLSEIIVVGYGSQAKEKIGSAISQIKAKDIEKLSAGSVSIESILSGQIKGLNITQGSGKPGASASINIRGITSPFGGSNNQPLFVIDGVAFNTDPVFDVGPVSANTENPLLSVNPNDIESISVLKDAAATAIYGSRGANGVIIITTKKGTKNSGVKVDYSYSYSFANPTNTIDVMNAEQFKELQIAVARNTILAYQERPTGLARGWNEARLLINPTTLEPYNTYVNSRSGETIPNFGNGDTNWQDELYNQGAGAHNHYVNLRGGGESVVYNLAFSHADQDGLVGDDNLKRYGARMNIESDFNKYVKIGSSISYNLIKNSSPGSAASNTTTGVFTMRPDYNIFQDNGIDYQRIQSSWRYAGVNRGFYYFNNPNPVAGVQRMVDVSSNNFIGNVFLELTPIKDLKVRTQVSAGQFNTVTNSFVPKVALSDFLLSELTNSVGSNSSRTGNVTLDVQATYNKKFGQHDVTAMLGMSNYRSYYFRESQFWRDTPDDVVLINPASAANSTDIRGGKAVTGINSYFSRLQYLYAGKYALTLNFRSDKSSKFGPNNQIGYFPSAALNWNIAKENFLENADFIDKLSLRASYGKTGSANVDDFTYLQFFSLGNGVSGTYANNAAIIPGNRFPNEDIQWENTVEKNLGLNFSLFNNRLDASIDIYDKYTDGVLAPAPIFLESGSTQFSANLAEISNKGLEISLGGDLIRNEDFNWRANFNIAYNRNRIEAIKGTAFSDYLLDSYVIGQPIGVIRGYEVEHIIQTTEEIEALNAASPFGRYHNSYTWVGDYKYKDTNEDGRITTSDRTIIGSSQPDYFGGFSTEFSYKGLSLGLAFNYAVGNEKAFTSYGALNTYPNYMGNMSPDALANSWTPENTEARNGRLIYGNFMGTYLNDRMVQDASYLRLKFVRLNYNLPKEALGSYVANANIYLTASNLLTWTNYEGLDPESAGTGSIAGLASDSSPYPFSTTVTLGIKVGF